MKLKINDDAVSPVIGVILMVAITVILAAVIAVFVFNMAGDVQTTKTVGVTAKLQGDDVIVTYVGGSDHDSLQRLNVTVDDKAPSSFLNSPPNVGDRKEFPTNTSATRHSVVVVGTFSDGTTQVLLDTTL